MQNPQVLSTPPPFPASTYIPRAVCEPRVRWFLDKKKRPVLDGIVAARRPYEKEYASFYYPKAGPIKRFFEGLLAIDGMTGMRVYFGSWGDNVENYGGPNPIDRDDRFKLVLFYVPTTGIGAGLQNINSEFYYLDWRLRTQPVKLDKNLAIALREDYIKDKASALGRTTLHPDDVAKSLGETTSVFFSRDLIGEINNEIGYQLEMPNRVSGFRVQIASYTDIPPPGLPHALHQRLTVQFTFTDSQGQDLDMVDEDPRYAGFVFSLGNAYNTGNPTPPHQPDDIIT